MQQSNSALKPIVLQEKVCLIVPCFNEAARLDVQKFLDADPLLFYIFVDDGSSDQTSQIIKKHVSGRLTLVQLEKNQGKAEAVRQGMLHFLKDESFQGIRWAGFWDADLATPLSQVAIFLQYKNFYRAPIAIWGSRVYRLGGKILRSRLRHILGRVFATVIGILFKVESYDTQCGSKIFRRDIISQAFHRPFISKWIFDVEILLALKGEEVIECPVAYWEDIKGSKLKIFPSLFKVMGDIIAIRRRYGKY